MFDRDGQYGYRFFCMHHYGMQGELPRPTKVARKPSQKGTLMFSLKVIMTFFSEL